MYSKSYIDHNGKFHDGVSIIDVGAFSNPVKWEGRLKTGLATNKDVLERIYWEKVAETRKSGTLSLTFSVGWGPINLKYTSPSTTTRHSVYERNFLHINWGGSSSSAPGNFSVPFTDTKLSKVGHEYGGLMYVTHTGSNARKAIETKYIMPYFDREFGTYLGQKTMTLNLDYISY